MNITPDVVTIVVGLIVVGVPALIGWLVTRAVNGISTEIRELKEKVDAIARHIGETREEVAELRGRVKHLEVVHVRKASAGG